MYVEVLQDRRSPCSRFLSLRGRCGLCFKKAVFGSKPSAAADERPACVAPNNVQRGAPRWCGTHRRPEEVALLPLICKYETSSTGSCIRSARMCSSDKMAAWRLVLASKMSERRDSIICDGAKGCEEGFGAKAGAGAEEDKAFLHAERIDVYTGNRTSSETKTRVEKQVYGLAPVDEAALQLPAAEMCEKHGGMAQGILPMVS